MKIPVSEELITIFRNILAKNKTVDEWSEIESDDTFQTPSFCGGFDATEKAFCFRYYDKAGEEFWFQLTLDEIDQFVGAPDGEIGLRPARK
jgi:hypothetical protein